jgi:probable HAF family extracellular repeat protein
MRSLVDVGHADRFVTALAAACGLVFIGASAATAISIHGLGSINSFPHSASSHGTIVALNQWIEDEVLGAFRWTRQGLDPLGDFGGVGPLGGAYSEAFCVSGDGSTLVGWSFSSEGVEAYRWSAASGMARLGQLHPDLFASGAYAVSYDGSVIVGFATTPTGEEAFRWSRASGMVGLGDLGTTTGLHSIATAVSADGEVVTGHAGSVRSGAEAFRWTAAGGMVGLGGLPDALVNSHPTAISADGSTIVGFAQGRDGWEAFRGTEASGTVGLGDLPGGAMSSRAMSVSGNGSIVVGMGASEETNQEAFIWTESGGMQALDDYLTSRGVAVDWFSLIIASSISADGNTIVGYGGNPDGSPQGFILTLPEPSSTAMIALGVLGLAGRACRIRVARRRRAPSSVDRSPCPCERLR